MHKIAIIGNRPENIRAVDNDLMRSKVDSAIELLSWQYSYDQFMFNIIGERGVCQWAIEKCIAEQLGDPSAFRYHLFLPFMVEETSKFWYDDQKAFLSKAFENASATTIVFPTLLHKEEALVEAEKSAIRDSSFVVAFWSGQKQGKTYSAMQYAMNTNKLVLDGLRDLKMITRATLKKGAS